MHVAFLYNEPSEDPSQQSDDDPDSSPIVAALERWGHEVTRIACTLDLAEVRRRLERAALDVVFNRVDSLGGSDGLMAVVTILLDAMGLAYTGCPTQAIVAVSSKIAVKERLLAAGLPTPAWIDEAGRICSSKAVDLILRTDGHATRYILKSVYEHASFQIEDASVVGSDDPEAVAALIRECAVHSGRPFFAEQFIDGREFNLSLWGPEPEVLPPAEIDFSAFPAGKPRIVGHQAKWNPASFEYDETRRRFHFPAADSDLLSQLKELAIACWRLFGLAGYARVDFRIDAAGQPWILEINANPSLSPTSGFAAALEAAGIRYDEGIQRILDYAVGPSRKQQLSAFNSSNLSGVEPQA